MVLGLLLVIFFLVYRYISEYFSRWKRLGVTCVPFTFNKRHINEVTRENYARFRHLDFFGTCVGGKPALVVNNLETVRAVLDKDFNSFMNRHDSNVKQILDGGPIDQVMESVTNTYFGLWLVGIKKASLCFFSLKFFM